MASKYSIDELRFHGDSEAEQTRTRNVFLDLKSKADAKQQLTEHEKNFFCNGLTLSRLNYGTIEMYPCCDNYKFKYLYLVYFRDLTGGTIYRKIGLNAKPYFVPPAEAQKDLEYLIERAEEWDLIIQKDHPEPMLLQTIVEARQEIKILDKLPEIVNDPYAKERSYYRYKRWAILLHFKWLYCFGLEFFEATDPEDLKLEINASTIEFNEYSLVHILNRHYSKITKQFNSDKSYHVEDFKPKVLGHQLKTILKEIDDKKALAGKPLDKIAFKHNGIDYIMWTAEKTKSIKGKGNVLYRRVETFYPVAEEEEKIKLVTNYNLINVREGLDVYVAK